MSMTVLLPASVPPATQVPVPSLLSSGETIRAWHDWPSAAARSGSSLAASSRLGCRLPGTGPRAASARMSTLPLSIRTAVA